jgi:hypothetical protein
MSTSFRSDACDTPLRDSAASHINNGETLRGSPSQEGPVAQGDEKDDEIARLKRAYHDAVMENNNRKASTKINT